MKAYLRTTHVDGIAIQFSPEAKAVWQCHGLVGHLLDERQPMTADEVLKDVVKYHRDNYEDETESEADVQASLAILVAYRLAAEVEI